jgi:hypothetical protein
MSRPLRKRRCSPFAFLLQQIRDFLYGHKTKQLRALTGQEDLSVDDVRAVHDE